MARTYIRRRYYGTAQDFAETERPVKKKKKRSFLKTAATVGAGIAGAAAATKYGAKAYGNRQKFRAAAADKANLGAKADKIRGGAATKWADRIGGIGDKQLSGAKQWAGQKASGVRRGLAADQGRYDREKAARDKLREQKRQDKDKQYKSRVKARGDKMLEHSNRKHKGFERVGQVAKRLVGRGD